MINGVKEPCISDAHGAIVRNAFGKDTQDLVTGRSSPKNSYTKRIEAAYLHIVNYHKKENLTKEDIDNGIPAAAKKYNLKEATLYRILKTR